MLDSILQCDLTGAKMLACAALKLHIGTQYGLVSFMRSIGAKGMGAIVKLWQDMLKDAKVWDPNVKQPFGFTDPDLLRISYAQFVLSYDQVKEKVSPGDEATLRRLERAYDTLPTLDDYGHLDEILKPENIIKITKEARASENVSRLNQEQAVKVEAYYQGERLCARGVLPLRRRSRLCTTCADAPIELDAEYGGPLEGNQFWNSMLLLGQSRHTPSHAATEVSSALNAMKGDESRKGYATKIEEHMKTTEFRGFANQLSKLTDPNPAGLRIKRVRFADEYAKTISKDELGPALLSMWRSVTSRRSGGSGALESE